MSIDDFVTYQKFHTLESSLDLARLLKENEIEYIVDDTSLSFDPFFSNNQNNREFRIKLQKESFEKADLLIAKLLDTPLSDVDKNYYLFEFTNDELMEVIERPDEWNSFDFLTAQKILKQRGHEITQEKIKQIKNERLIQLSRPEDYPKNKILLGYIFSFVAPTIGLFLGWNLLSDKKTLPNGERIYNYTIEARTNGNRIFIIAGAFFLIRVIIFILYKHKI